MTHANHGSTKQVCFHLNRGLRPAPHPTSQRLSQLSLPGPQVGHQMTLRVPALVSGENKWEVWMTWRETVDSLCWWNSFVWIFLLALASIVQCLSMDHNTTQPAKLIISITR